jgi:hypothetical protein
MAKKLITEGSREGLFIRLPKSEKAILDQYCQLTDRRQTDVIREYIRSLETKLQPH